MNLHNYCYLSSVHAMCLSFHLLAQTILNRDSGSVFGASYTYTFTCFIYVSFEWRFYQFNFPVKTFEGDITTQVVMIFS